MYSGYRHVYEIVRSRLLEMFIDFLHVAKLVIGCLRHRTGDEGKGTVELVEDRFEHDRWLNCWLWEMREDSANGSVRGINREVVEIGVSTGFFKLQFRREIFGCSGGSKRGMVGFK